jgi:hypothetical protein
VDAQTVKWILTFSGAAAELTGLGLVILDVRDARAAAQAVSTTTTLPPRRRTEAGRWRGRVGRPVASYGRTEVSTRDFEEFVTRFMKTLETAFQQLEDRLAADVEELIAGTVGDVQQRETDLRTFLAGQLTSGIGRRTAGVVLLSFGIVASAAANLVG